MPRIPGLKRAARAVVRRPSVEEDVDAELRFHLEMRVDDLVAGGMTPEAARGEAMREFGDYEHYSEDCRRIGRQRERDMRRLDVTDALRQDLRYAARQLRRSPGFTLTAVLLLALGLGATSAIYSVVSALLLRPLPFAGGDRVVVLAEYDKHERERDAVTTSYTNFVDWLAQAKSFEAMTTWEGWSPALSGGGGEPERITGALVHPGVFKTLGVRPLLGRAFRDDEAVKGSDINVVLSYGFWQRRFGSDPGILGKPIVLNGRSRVVVGVLPPDFRAPPALNVDVWGNLPYDPNDECRTCRHHQAYGRLKPGVTLAQARGEMHALAAREEAAYPKENAGQQIAVIPLRERMVGGLREPLWLLLGASALVLLIACTNLSNLLIARGMARAREFAIRTALGADRPRAVRQLLTESLLLASLGGAAGLAVALWTARVVARVGPATVRDVGVGIDWHVVAFTAAASLLTGVAFGLLPALRTAAADVHAALKEGVRGSSASGGRVRDALVVAQLALALTLLVGAGLLIRSFVRLQRVDPGFRTTHLLTANVNLPSKSYPKPEGWEQFFGALLERVRALPGVAAAAATSNVPLSGNWDRVGFRVVGKTYATDADQPQAERYVVTPGYFRAMGITLASGRLLTEQDRAGAPRAVVIDEALAKELFPGESPIGKQFTQVGAGDTVTTVVGVVRHVKHYGLDVEGGGQLYLSTLQYPTSFLTLVVRTTGDPLAMTPAVRRELKALDPAIPLFGVQSMDELLAGLTATRRFILALLGAFAGVAITMAAVGLYGVVAYAVSQRRREIGIRMALGAQRRDVLGMVVRRGVLLAAAGVVAGLAAALGAARLMTSLLFGVSATDPLVFAAVPLLLFAVAVLASWLPARRASAVDPLVALRSE